MKKSANIVSVIALCLLLNAGLAFSQGATNLPSEQTWSEIEGSATPATSAEGAASPSLRAAPPDGPAIGETPLGETSVLALLLTGFVYFSVKNRKARHRK